MTLTLGKGIIHLFRISLVILILLEENQVCGQLYPVFREKGYQFIDQEGKSVGAEDSNSFWLSASDIYPSGSAIVQATTQFSLFGVNGDLLKNESVRFDSIYHLQGNIFVGLEKRSETGMRFILDRRTTLNLSDSIERFYPLQIDDTTFFVVRKDTLTWLISEDGTERLKPLKLDSLEYVGNGYFLTRKKNRKGIYHVSGTEYLETIYDHIVPGTVGHTTYKDGKKGYKRMLNAVDPKTKQHRTFFLEPNYNEIHYFGQRYLLLEKENERELYDIYQRKVIATGFPENVHPMNEKYHLAEENGKFALLDVGGNKLTGFDYDKIQDAHYPDRFFYKKGSGYGIMNGKGKELSDPKYQRLFPFEVWGLKSRYYTKYQSGEGVGLIGANGKVLCDPDYLDIRFLSGNRTICVKKDSSVRTFIMNEYTGKVEDYYDLVHVKLLSVQKNRIGSGNSDLRKKLTLSEDRSHYSYSLVNRKNGTDYRFDNNTYYDIEVRQWDSVSNNTTVVFSELEEYSMAPEKVTKTILHIDWWRQFFGRSHPYLYSDPYKKVRLLDEDLFLVNEGLEDEQLLNGSFLPYSHRIGKTDKKQMYSDFQKGNKSFPYILKGERKNDFAHLVRLNLPGDRVMEFTGYDSMTVWKGYIFGFKNKRWNLCFPYSKGLMEDVTDFRFNEDILLLNSETPSWYLYDSTGMLVQTFDTSDIVFLDEHERMILVQVRDSFNYITPNGVFLLQQHAEKAYSFKNGFASIVKDSVMYLINEQGQISEQIEEKPLVFNSEGIMLEQEGGTSVLKDTSGNNLFESDQLHLFPIKDADIFSYKQGDSRLFGLMSATGEKITEPLFKSVKPFKENTLLVKTDKGTGLVDAQTGKEILPCKYRVIRYGNEGYFIVSKKRKWQIVKRDGALLTKSKFLHVASFNELGFAKARTKKGPVYVFADGKVDMEKPDVPELKKRLKEEKMSWLDAENGLLGVRSLNIPVKYHELRKLSNGCIVGIRRNRYAVKNKRKKTLVESCFWDKAELLPGNILRVNKAGEISYYNLTTQTWIYQNKKSAPPN